MDQSIGARFWAKVNCAGSHQRHMKTCCWEWLGSTNHDGYGRFRYLGRLERAHAVSLSWTLGRMPKYVMHLCDNPACVRPSHLQESTHSSNMRDAYRKNRRPDCTPKGTACKHSVFTEEQVRDIRSRYAQGESQAAIGAVYGVHQAHISKIVRKKTYASVPDEPAKVGDSWDQAK